MKHRFALWQKFTSRSLPDRIGWSTLAMAAIFLVYNLITALLDPVWQQWAFAGISAVFLAVVFIGVQQMRAGRLRIAGWLLIIGMEALTFSVVLLYTNIAILAATIAGAYALLLAPQTLPRKETTLGIIQGLIVGSSIYIFDFLNPLPRTAPLAPQTAWVLAAVLLLLYVVSLAQQFPSLDMRTKYILGTLVGAAVVITALMTYYINSSTDILVSFARQRLHTSAQQAAREVDNFLFDALARVQMGSVLAGVRELASEDVHTPAQQAKVEHTLGRLGTLTPAFFHSLIVVDRTGQMLASAPADLQSDATLENQNATYALRAQLEESFIAPVETAPDGRSTIAFVSRVVNREGEPVGALIARYHTTIFQDIIEKQTGAAGPDSFAVLVDNNQVILAHGISPETRLHTLAEATLMTEQMLRDLPYRSFMEIELHSREHVEEETGLPEQAAIVGLANRPWQVLFSQPTYTLLIPVHQQARASGLVSLAFLISTAMTTLLIANYLTRPVVALTEAAQAISEGNLDTRAPILSEDETGVLARTFNATVGQLQDILSTLESQVAERTAALETRSAYLRTTTEITSAISAVLDPGILASESANLIKQRFGLFYAGLFLRDSTGEWAELRAGTGAAGEKMLARGHRIRIGSGVVGWSILYGKPRIARETERDTALPKEFPELSAARSEAALPLRSRGQVLGAILVQSEAPDAFDEDTLAILQIMADQIAVALDNAYLFKESERALQSVQRAFGKLTRSAWKNLLHARPAWGYHYRNERLIPADGPWPAALQRALREEHPIQENGETPTLTLPLQVRGNTIGALQIRKSANALAWSPEEVDALQRLTRRIATALDNARLYQESQRRALQEQIRGQLLSRVHQQTTLEKVLSTAADEIYDTLALEEITIQLMPPSTGGDDAHE